MIEHYWIISSMDTAPSEDGLTDVVKTVHWRRDAKEIDGDKTYYGDVYGAMGCSAPDPMAYTPYADLTFDQVCTWLEANLDTAALDMALDSQIEMQKNPPIVQLPLPWQPQPNEVKVDNVEETI
jgi:hypothetical protein